MKMFIFQSGKNPEAYGFSGEPTGTALPQTMAPWLLRGRREGFPKETLTGMCSAAEAVRALNSVRVDVRWKTDKDQRV